MMPSQNVFLAVEGASIARHGHICAQNITFQVLKGENPVHTRGQWRGQKPQRCFALPALQGCAEGLFGWMMKNHLAHQTGGKGLHRQALLQGEEQTSAFIQEVWQNRIAYLAADDAIQPYFECRAGSTLLA